MSTPNPTLPPAPAHAPQIQSGSVPADETTVTFPVPFHTEPKVALYLSALSLDYQGGPGKASVVPRIKLISRKGFTFEVEHVRFGYAFAWIAHT